MLITVRNLVKIFHESQTSIATLNDVSFNIRKGEMFGIVGKSGAGKSTLLNILSLQSNFTSGVYQMFDKIVNTLSNKDRFAFIRRTSFIHQGFSLLYNLTVLENIALPLKLRKVDKTTRIQKAIDVLTFVGLLDKKDSYPITLSGGEAQRIAIARALITNPEIIFADEPTSSLDDATAYDILNLLKDVNKTYKTAIIFVSHQTQLVKYLCTRVLLLNEGKIERLDKIVKQKNNYKDYASILWEDNI